MTLRDALNKIRTNLPFVALGLSIFSTNMVINNHYRNKKLVETALETNRLITDVNNKQDILINKNEITEKIRNYTIEATNNVNSVNEKRTIIDELIKKLDDPNISTEDREFITNVLIEHNNQSIEYLNKSNELLQKIIDEFNKSGDKFINEIYD
jgi:polyhydroxyalkanoate synthesis regulator phasin